MRRRRPVHVWPAVADLMTVLAVLGLFSALALIPATQDKTGLLDRVRALQKEVSTREAELEECEEALEELSEQCETQREEYEEQLREAALNEKMFQAVQEVQRIVDEISADQQLQFSEDQTLQFGDDLVEYDINSTYPRFRPAGRERLRRFCQLLSQKLDAESSAVKDIRDVFVLEVQGHTDDTQCPNDPHCNWWISASRAAHFITLMHDPDLCPGTEDLRFRAVGLAQTEPPVNQFMDSKRIIVKLSPLYDQLWPR